jgi:hypothetical protein
MSGDQLPARVATLAAQVNDTPLSWKEYDSGVIVIVFANKGKKTFEPEPEQPQAGSGLALDNSAQAEDSNPKPKRRSKHGISNPD